MADLKLDILVIPTYSVLSLAIMDASTYPDDPPIVSGATIEITVPSFGIVTLPFYVGELNLFNSSNLGISEIGVSEPLPDGIYYIKYSIAPSTINYVTKTIIRVDQLQEKFDEAFMKLDMMECDRAIKTQSKVDLNSIYFFIQGSIAAANNCAVIEANKLYRQADNMLNNFIKTNCGCSGNNYQTNFY
tara:strand:- start:1878 stop:2441 length:564 start_codon:yes stop_codon:yes gene_type:complete